MTHKAVLIVSGGMDSITMAYHYRNLGYELHLLSFNYGQRHKKELECARWVAKSIGAEHNILDLSYVGSFLKGSALSDPGISVPHGHYSADNMKVTVVPNRNAIMLTIAYGIALSENARFVGTAVHAGDHAIYPDCREAFMGKLEEALVEGSTGLYPYLPTINTPYIFMTKADILREGLRAGVPYEHTWTCYEGRDLACGRCGTCVERLEAFAENGGTDPLLYADYDYWRTVTQLKEFRI